MTAPDKDTAAIAADREIELALMIDAASLPLLSAVPAAVGALNAPARHARTIYFDTDDLALKRQGISIRLRIQGGQVEQTVKTANRTVTGLKDRRELNAVLPLAQIHPDPLRISDPILREIVEAVADRLQPVFETAVDRRKTVCTSPCGSRIELVVDCGDLIAGALTRPICEVEVELKSGRPGALYDVAAEIAHAVPVRIGALSKADRGYALAEGLVPGFCKADPLTLDPDQDVESAFAAIASACLGHLVANEPAVMESRLPEGVHQMRVALRRLRAALTVFRKPLGRQALAPLGSRAKLLASALGDVRDLDVMREDILDPAAKAVRDPDALIHLTLRLEAARAQAWDRLLTEFGQSSQVAGFLFDLAGGLDRKFWRNGFDDAPKLGSLSAFAAQVLDGRAKTVRKGGKTIETLSIDARHDLRIEIKKLRYAMEFFGSLYERDAVAAYVKQVSKLQDLFGSLNDVATAQRLLPALAGDAKSPAGQAALQIVAWHEAQADKAWRKAQARFEAWQAADPFWRRNNKDSGP